MKVAVSTHNASVSEHFGRCPEFTLAEILDGKVVSTEVIENPGHQPNFLPGFLREMGAEAIIAGGMGPRAQALFNESSIRTYTGITGTVDEALQRLCNGTLADGESLCKPGDGKGYGLDKTECDHDDHDHHDH